MGGGVQPEGRPVGHGGMTTGGGRGATSHRSRILGRGRGAGRRPHSTDGHVRHCCSTQSVGASGVRRIGAGRPRDLSLN